MGLFTSCRDDESRTAYQEHQRRKETLFDPQRKLSGGGVTSQTTPQLLVQQQQQQPQQAIDSSSVSILLSSADDATPSSPLSPTTLTDQPSPYSANGTSMKHPFSDAAIMQQQQQDATGKYRNNRSPHKGSIFTRLTSNKPGPIDDPTPVYKILLLGTGETGKSTIAKQLRYKFDSSGLDEEEKKQYKTFIICNVVTALGRTCEYMNEEGIPFSSDDIADVADIIVRLSERQSYLVMNAVKEYDQQLYERICVLWADRTIQKVLREHMSDFHICDSVLYFFENLDLMQPPFEVPSETQVMQVCRKTTGIIQQFISFTDVKLHIVDVGGQRNERKKWKNAFNGVNMVLFVVSLSDYDQQLYEDESVNRLLESLEVFQSLVHEEVFKNCPFFLIFNKVESFKHRIEELMHDLHLCFPEYHQGSNATLAMKYIEEQFTKLYRQRDGSQKLYIEYVNATNGDEMDIFFDKMKEFIKENVFPPLLLHEHSPVVTEPEKTPVIDPGPSDMMVASETTVILE